jgi:hypothetical protein
MSPVPFPWDVVAGELFWSVGVFVQLAEESAAFEILDCAVLVVRVGQDVVVVSYDGASVAPLGDVQCGLVDGCAGDFYEGQDDCADCEKVTSFSFGNSRMAAFPFTWWARTGASTYGTCWRTRCSATASGAGFWRT